MSNINLGLSVNDVVTVNVSLTPTGAALRNFGGSLILGDSGIIDVSSRYRLYTSLEGVEADFGGTAPEALAAGIFFAQNPTPAELYIGAWARTATPGTLIGSVLSASQQALSNFTSITSGGLTITINGTQRNVTGLNLTSVSNLNAVASALQTALAGTAVVTWNANNGFFELESATLGTGSTITFATSPISGTDISGLMGLNSTSSGAYVVAGIAAESPLAAVTTLANMTSNWYSVGFAASVMPQDSDYVAVAGLIQGISISRIFGVTTQEAAALVSSNSSDVASQLQALGYSRTYVQYSSQTPYAVEAMSAIASTVDFLGSDTAITMKFQQEAGATAETLTESQAASLNGKNCNVFVNYNNGTAILQQGTMANGTFFDVIQGTDWLQNYIQTNIFNLFYTAKTKIPQTDQGVNQVVANITQSLIQAVDCDLVAPGVWTGPNVGAIVTGQTLSTGFYVYAPPISSQSSAARAARQTPVIQVAIKLSGALHSANVLVSVNQ